MWVTQLKSEKENYIPMSDITDISELHSKDQYTSHIKAYESRGLCIDTMVLKSDIKHIQMTEVPKAYYTTLRSRKGLDLSFYNNLLQITERNHGMIFDLDSMKEVHAIENIDQFQNPDHLISTGFIMSTSKNEVRNEGEQFIRRTQIISNEYVNLLFEKV